MLLGDSLINKPFQLFDLGGKIASLVPEYNLEITNCGFNGAKVFAIRNVSLYECAIPATPDVVIIFFHSDASDVDLASMQTTIVSDLDMNYRINLGVVIDVLQKDGSLVALSSTGVLSETHAALFQPNTQDRFHNKWPIMRRYTGINLDVAAEFGIPFINIRQAFLDYVPWYQLCYAWCVTYDGEHENERGTKIVAKLFASTINDMLSKHSKTVRL